MSAGTPSAEPARARMAHRRHVTHSSARSHLSSTRSRPERSSNVRPAPSRSCWKTASMRFGDAGRSRRGRRRNRVDPRGRRRRRRFIRTICRCASPATPPARSRGPTTCFACKRLGFRGEALASIAAVSQLRIRSRQADSPTGYELAGCRGHVAVSRSRAVVRAGTQIEIRQLFVEHACPPQVFCGRRRPSSATSANSSRGMALAHPRLHAVLRHNSKPVYELPAAPDSARERYGCSSARSWRIN